MSRYEETSPFKRNVLWASLDVLHVVSLDVYRESGSTSWPTTEAGWVVAQLTDSAAICMEKALMRLDTCDRKTASTMASPLQLPSASGMNDDGSVHCRISSFCYLLRPLHLSNTTYPVHCTYSYCRACRYSVRLLYPRLVIMSACHCPTLFQRNATVFCPCHHWIIVSTHRSHCITFISFALYDILGKLPRIEGVLANAASPWEDTEGPTDSYDCLRRSTALEHSRSRVSKAFVEPQPSPVTRICSKSNTCNNSK
jgi:hypothetical protein